MPDSRSLHFSPILKCPFGDRSGCNKRIGTPLRHGGAIGFEPGNTQDGRFALCAITTCTFGPIRLMFAHTNFMIPYDVEACLMSGVYSVVHKAGLEWGDKNALPHPLPAADDPSYCAIGRRAGFYTHQRVIRIPNCGSWGVRKSVLIPPRSLRIRI